MVRQMTKMIADGVIGKLHKVDAQYLQGWLNPVIHEKEKRFEYLGPSSTTYFKK